MVFNEVATKQYTDQGYCIVENVFNEEELLHLSRETETLLAGVHDGLVMEDDKKTVRSLNAPHLKSAMMAELARKKALLETSRTLLNDEVYIHQYKINTKRAFDGEEWQWHSDYWFWQNEDGMQTPNALTAVIFLDDIHEFNGPMWLVPGSYKEVLSEDHYTRSYSEIDGGENWHITTSKKLKYQLSKEYLSDVIMRNGIVSATAKKGSVLFFHCNLLHFSSANNSPWDRRGIFISYNAISNALIEVDSPRPTFLANRDATPIL